MWEQIEQWDRELFVYLNSLGIERYDGFWIFVTDPRHWIPLYLLFFFIILSGFSLEKSNLFNSFLLATVFSTWGFTNLVKGIALRLRPNNTSELTDVIRILQEPTNYSFFSGHSSTSFAATTFLVLVLAQKSRWIYLAYIWPVIFVMSRIYVGVHYPGDILVGMIVGIIFALIFYKFYERSGRTLY